MGLAAAAALGALLGLVPAATAAPETEFQALPKGQTLHAGDEIEDLLLTTGAPETDTLEMQGDGNLVEYNYRATETGNVKTVCWASNTFNQPGNHATCQNDGNFVVYNPAGRAVWASNTVGKPGSTVSLSEKNGSYYVGQTLIHGACVS